MGSFIECFFSIDIGLNIFKQKLIHLVKFSKKCLPYMDYIIIIP